MAILKLCSFLYTQINRKLARLLPNQTLQNKIHHYNERSTHFEKFLAEHNQYIKKLTNELGLYDENITVHFVRSVFHTLRDRLTLQQSFHVLAHLPAFLKLYYIEGWKYKTQASRIDTSSEFYKIAGERFREISGNSIHPKKTIAECTLVVLASLREFLDEGTIRHIYAELPASLHQLFEFPVEK